MEFNNTGILNDGGHPELPREVGYGSWGPDKLVSFEEVGYLQHTLPECTKFYRKNEYDEWVELPAAKNVIVAEPIAEFRLRVVIPMDFERK